MDEPRPEASPTPAPEDWGKFHIKYQVEVGEFSKEELANWGGTDALVFVGIRRADAKLESPKGWTVLSWDGWNKSQMHPLEMYQCWTFLGETLLRQAALPNPLARVVARSLEKTKELALKSQRRIIHPGEIP